MTPLLYVLITEHYATLLELKEKYTLDDALDLYEACYVHMHNKAEAMRIAAKTKKD